MADDLEDTIECGSGCKAEFYSKDTAGTRKLTKVVVSGLTTGKVAHLKAWRDGGNSYEDTVSENGTVDLTSYNIVFDETPLFIPCGVTMSVGFGKS